MDLNELKELGEYASVQHCIDKYCIKSGKPIVFFEVGVMDGACSAGFYSYMEKNSRDDNRYFAFEPFGKNYLKIKNNSNFPHDKKGVELVNKAIFSKTGKLTLHTSSGKTVGNPNEYEGCSSLLEPTEVKTIFPFLKFGSELVDAITIDDFCKEKNIGGIDFIFADIQGAEGEMVKGAVEMLPNIKFMFLEKSDKDILYDNQPLTNDLIELMAEHGFAVAKVFECDILFYNKKLV